MGFLSKVWKGIKKGVKKVWKGVKKVGKKIFSGVKKVWDKFRKSAIGKAIMVAAAIYFGGVALGAWGGAGGTTAAATTLGTQASSAVAANTVMAAGELGAASVLAPGAAGVGAGSAAAAAGVAGAAQSTVPGLVAAGQQLSSQQAANTVMQSGELGTNTVLAPGQTVGGGAPVVQSTPTWVNPSPTPDPSTFQSIQNYGSSALDWAKANPELTIAGGQAISAMTAEDPYDTWRKQQEYLRRNSNIAGVSGTGEGDPIGMGLIRQSQQADLYSPTYQVGG